MCRNIKRLYNYEPPATRAEIAASARQYVRKVSGFHEPSQANQLAFEKAVDEIASVTQELLDSLVTSAPSRDRAADAERARRPFSARSS